MALNCPKLHLFVLNVLNFVNCLNKIFQSVCFWLHDFCPWIHFHCPQSFSSWAVILLLFVFYFPSNCTDRRMFFIFLQIVQTECFLFSFKLYRQENVFSMLQVVYWLTISAFSSLRLTVFCVCFFFIMFWCESNFILWLKWWILTMFIFLLPRCENMNRINR